jgi:hypothetical protein
LKRFWGVKTVDISFSDVENPAFFGPPAQALFIRFLGERQMGYPHIPFYPRKARKPLSARRFGHFDYSLFGSCMIYFSLLGRSFFPAKMLQTAR